MSPKSIDVGPLEMKVLGILDEKPAASVSVIQTKLKEGGHSLAYTTVMTVLSRLYEKGYLKRSKEGRQFLYEAATKNSGASKKSTSQRIFNKVKESLFGKEKLKPILALLNDEDTLSKEDLSELKRIIDEKLRNEMGKQVKK